MTDFDENENSAEKEGANPDQASKHRWLLPVLIIAAIVVVLVVIIVVVILITTKSDDDKSDISKPAYSTELYKELDEEDQKLIQESEDISTISVEDTPIIIEDKSYSASYPISEGKKVYCLATDEKTFTATEDSKNVFVVTEGAQLVLSGKITITKTSTALQSRQNTVSDATNAALVVSGANSLVSLYGVSILTDVTSAHALVAMNSGRAKLSECTIHTEGEDAFGLYSLSSASITGNDVHISTEGERSPLVYSAATVSLDTADGEAEKAQVLVLEGNSETTTKSCTFTCSGHGHTKDTDNVVISNAAIVIYGTEAGDATAKTATYTDTDSIISLSESSSLYTVAPFFFVTNTKATIKMTGSICNFYRLSYFISAQGASWGTADENGGTVSCTLSNIQRSSTLNLRDPISSITDEGSHISVGLLEYSPDLSEYDYDLVIYRSGTYTLTGSFAHTLFINADSVALLLNGVTIESPLTAAIVSVRTGEFTIHVLPSTTNTFSDFKDGTDEYDACIYSNGHLIIQGTDTGVLNINGKRKRGIATMNEGMTISGGVGINIVSKGDGLVTDGTGGTIKIIGGYMYIESGGTGIVSKKDADFKEGVFYSPGSSISCTDGYVIEGVTIVATGTGMLENRPKKSEQYAFSFTMSSKISAGTLVVLTDSTGAPVMAFDARQDFTTLILTLPALTTTSYHLYTGGTMSSHSVNHFYPCDGATYDPTGATKIQIGECTDFTITSSSDLLLSYDSTCKTQLDGEPEDAPTPDIGTEDPTILPLYPRTHPVQSRCGISYSFSDVTVTRTIPASAKDGGLGRYPQYGTAMSTEGLTDAEATALKENIINENKAMLSTTSMSLSGNLDHYDHMDAEGYFLLNGERIKDTDGETDAKLFKHTAAAGMYYGNVDDSDEAIEKTITITPRPGGNYITGLYAPPGEIVTVSINEDDLNNIGSVPLYIGQVYSNGVALTIGTASSFTRMPTHCNRFILDKTTVYIGFHLGGPIYIGSPTNKVKFSVTISGAVPYPHFILGYTTEEEYKKSKVGKAPYFDLEVWDDSIRFSGSRTYADSYSWQELYDTALLWDKISRVSNAFPQSATTTLGIVNLFGPHVACGSACALKGQNTVTMPDGWMGSSLNAAEFIRNGGWGNIHELNHHYQSYGLPDGGEVTNNAVNIVEYSLFTIVGATRTYNTATDNTWPRFTDPWYTLRRTLTADTERPIVALSAYVNIFHTFGHSKYIEAAQNTQGSSGATVYYNALTSAMHYDFTYYFKSLLYYPTGTTTSSLTEEAQEAVAELNYPMFVPIACLYQTGRSYVYDGTKKYSKTCHPYRIDFENPFTFDLDDVLAYPSGVTVTVKSFTPPEYGSLIHNANGTYTYIPDSTHSTSGDFIFTFALTMDDESFEIEDVDLVLCFDELPPSSPSRVTYSYSSKQFTHVTDITDPSTNAISSQKWGWTTPALWWDGEGVAVNRVSTYNAKAYIPADKSYRIALRGKQAVLHFWTHDKIVDQTITIKDYFCNHYDKHSIPGNYYRDVELKKGDVLYFQVTLLHADTNQCFFEIGGSQQNDDGTYPIPNIITNLFTLWNPDYEPETYQSDYFLSRTYTAPTPSSTVQPTQQSFVKGTNTDSWDATFAITNIFDGKSTTIYHSKKNQQIASYPLTIQVQLDTAHVMNSMTISGRGDKTTDISSPVSYQLYVGTKEEDLQLVYTADNQALVNGKDSVATFTPVSFSYYKLVITKVSRDYAAIGGISFSLTPKELSPDSEDFTFRGDWNWEAQHSSYGHVYTTANGQIEYTFTGLSFAIMTAADDKEQSFTVTFDDGEEEEVTVAADTEGQAFSKSFDSESTHTVLIRAISTGLKSRYIKIASFNMI